jgi:two-component system, cell cycle sensor histidine kinase and response regulator CckA
MKQAKIMIVEDEAIVAADIQDRLKTLGYEVATLVHLGEDAEARATATKADLVLMDIKLRGRMDGVEAAERIRQSLDIPVVYLTAHADQATLQRAKVTEPFGYIVKPFDERALHTAIEIALYRHKVESRLQALEQWLEAVLGSMADAVVVTDKWGLVAMLNPAASQLTGWSQGEAVLKPLAEVCRLVDPKTRESVVTPIGQLLFDQATINWRNPMLLLDRGGGETLVDYTASPVRDAAHEETGVVLIFRCLSPRTAPPSSNVSSVPAVG